MVNNLAKKDIGWNMSKKICNIDYQMKNARLVCLIRTKTLVSASADVASMEKKLVQVERKTNN